MQPANKAVIALPCSGCYCWSSIRRAQTASRLETPLPDCCRPRCTIDAEAESQQLPVVADTSTGVEASLVHPVGADGSHVSTAELTLDCNTCCVLCANPHAQVDAPKACFDCAVRVKAALAVPTLECEADWHQQACLLWTC